MVKKIIPETLLIIDDKSFDKRNYHVSFDKINTELKFKCIKNINDGIKEVKKFVEYIIASGGNINDSIYYNFKVEQKNSFYD